MVLVVKAAGGRNAREDRVTMGSGCGLDTGTSRARLDGPRSRSGLLLLLFSRLAAGIQTGAEARKGLFEGGVESSLVG